MPLTSGVFNRGLFRLIGVAVVPLSLHAYHYSSLICSAQCARGWILMPWRMIVPRVAWTHTPTQIGSRSWSSTQRWSARTHTRELLPALPSETREPPLHLRGGGKAFDVTRAQTGAHTFPLPSLILYRGDRREEEGKKGKESVLSEINREIIPSIRFWKALLPKRNWNTHLNRRQNNPPVRHSYHGNNKQRLRVGSGSGCWETRLRRRGFSVRAPVWARA